MIGTWNVFRCDSMRTREVLLLEKYWYLKSIDTSEVFIPLILKKNWYFCYSKHIDTFDAWYFWYLNHTETFWYLKYINTFWHLKYTGTSDTLKYWYLIVVCPSLEFVRCFSLLLVSCSFYRCRNLWLVKLQKNMRPTFN